MRLPRYQTAALLKIFSAGFGLGLAVVLLLHRSDSPVPAMLHFTIFYVPMALAYVSLYSLIEHDSPSLLIVRALAEAGSSGRSRQELEDLFQEDIVESRLKAAISNGLVRLSGEGWALTPMGRVVGSVASLIKSIYGIRDGG